MRCASAPVKPTATRSDKSLRKTSAGNEAARAIHQRRTAGKNMGARSLRAAKLAAPIGLVGLATICASATPAFAAPSEINAADTAFMIVATALVLMMTIPGLALFYSGMVRKKNVLATMAQSLAAVAIISVLWVAF